MATQVESIKWVPGTRFLVDGFRFQHPACRAYFLTHAHSDHTTGLTSGFCAGGCLGALARGRRVCMDGSWCSCGGALLCARQVVPGGG